MKENKKMNWVLFETLLGNHYFFFRVSKMFFRADVQGLRAVAICAVLLFHAFPNFFPNGYLGVDMYDFQLKPFEQFLGAG